jgi:DNA-binding NarL/FixJ family response regulator
MAEAELDVPASDRGRVVLRSCDEEAPSSMGPQLRESRASRAAAPWVEAALEVALDRISGSAFVVSARGKVVHASHSGRALLRAERAKTEARIVSSPRRFAVTKSGRRGYEIVVLEPSLEEASTRARAIGAELDLSTRESEVLGLVANGLSNRLISHELGCAEKTVEGHVSSILGKTGCSTRSGLVARFWTHALDGG